MEVVFSNRAYAAVMAETTEKIQTETGGLFLGAYQNETWYIIESIDPGPRSIFEIAYFEYDQAYTQHLINKIANLYDKKLLLIGLWHRHPGGFDQFSSTDDGTNSKYAAMSEHGAISALINIDPTFRITMYHVASPCRYKKIKYKVGDEFIPAEYLQYKSPERFIRIMENIMNNHAQSSVGVQYKKTVSLASMMKKITPEISSCECELDGLNEMLLSEDLQNQLMDYVYSDLYFITEQVGAEVALSLTDKYLVVSQEAIDHTIQLKFGYSQSQKSVVLIVDNKAYLYVENMLNDAMLALQNKKNVAPTEEAIDQQVEGKGFWGTIIDKIRPNRGEDKNGN